MTAFIDHALADERHCARYATAAPFRARVAVTAPSPGRAARGAPRATRRRPRHRLGVLLVEAGFHLIASADRSRRPLTLAR